MALAHSASSPGLGAPSLAAATRKRYDSTPPPGPPWGPPGGAGSGLRRLRRSQGVRRRRPGLGGAGQDGRDVVKGPPAPDAAPARAVHQAAHRARRHPCQAPTAARSRASAPPSHPRQTKGRKTSPRRPPQAGSPPARAAPPRPRPAPRRAIPPPLSQAGTRRVRRSHTVRPPAHQKTPGGEQGGGGEERGAYPPLQALVPQALVPQTGPLRQGPDASVSPSAPPSRSPPGALPIGSQGRLPEVLDSEPGRRRRLAAPRSPRTWPPSPAPGRSRPGLPVFGVPVRFAGPSKRWCSRTSETWSPSCL